MLHGKLLSVTTKAGIGQGYTLEAVAVIRDRAVICIHPVSALPRVTRSCTRTRRYPGVGAGLPANTVAAATVNGRWKLASRPGPFAGKPAPTRRPVSHPRCASTTNPL
ncbi:hypothetical protein YSA_01618 [Pseudomonas putida ND6]|uniref:Uncharacterized protein n=1 Tax=Pseudomonas putida ND6 TaxID=231023 RepID=I3UQ81_PSEPU|nr:hypothetical protein YSA_01618 [Pseudomonas putida ND6]